MQSSTSLIQLEIIIFLRQRQFEIRIEIIPAPFYFLVVYFNGNCPKIQELGYAVPGSLSHAASHQRLVFGNSFPGR